LCGLECAVKSLRQCRALYEMARDTECAREKWYSVWFAQAWRVVFASVSSVEGLRIAYEELDAMNRSTPS